MRLRPFCLAIVFTCTLSVPWMARATPATITLTHRHHIFTLPVALHPEWNTPRRAWFFLGREAVPPARFKTCGAHEEIPWGWTTTLVADWNKDAIARTINDVIGGNLNRDPGTVTIARTASGSITFSGQGLSGRTVNAKLAATLVYRALKDNIESVVLPVDEVQPTITVEDSELRSMGIREVVTVGESVFARSPVNRRHNIAVGVKKFNGHIIPQGSIFSFNEVLGPVNDRTGYRKELVIQGEETLPDYGGGLCQVSSTAYRGPWEFGMPIIERKNHSYAVSYYSPQGTDATIYPTRVDMKFKNDTPGALLIQSFVDDESRAFFIYYGTKDSRMSEVFGPYISNRREAPKEERIAYTTDIPVGEKRKASERHDGMDAVWYRKVQREGTGATLERYFSAYQTRPLYWQIGVSVEDKARLTGGDTNDAPSWLPSTP